MRVNANDYVESMSAFKVSRERGKGNNAKLNAAEVKAFRGCLDSCNGVYSGLPSQQVGK